MTATTAVFAGDGSLLIQCAHAYLKAGHTIHAVASAQRSVLDWASSNGITAIEIDAGADPALRGP
jgi:hypothetical protein